MSNASSLMRDVEQYLARYVVVSDPTVYSVLALWIVGTYIFQSFDVFPYLCITAPVKRAGKTTLKELVGFASSKPEPIAGATEASIFRLIATYTPTLLIDEAESLSSEAAGTMRALMNVGFRRGQTLPRAVKGSETDVIRMPTYCPKVFVLIGDVNDTLRDRSIIITMARGTPAQEYRYDVGEVEGNELRTRIIAMLEFEREKVLERYNARVVAQPIAAQVSSRDRDLWLPLLSICDVFAPERLDAVYQCAVDMVTLKQTVEARSVVEYRRQDVEGAANEDEYASRLLAALVQLDGWLPVGKDEVLFSADMVQQLHELPLSPWRTFEGTGINEHRAAHMLKRFGVVPKLVQVTIAKNKRRVGRAYRWSQVDAAAGKWLKDAR